MPVPTTRAASALRTALAPGDAQRMTQAELARRLGIKSASVSAWKDAVARPEAHFRDALERLLGIPAGDWMTDDERRIAGGAAPSASPAAKSRGRKRKAERRRAAA